MQLFLRRAKFVKPGLEETKWKELSYQWMTEESGGESSEEIVRHQLPWRSECQRSQGKKGKFREKHRVSGIPSNLPAPSGPKWALRQEEALSESDSDSPADEEEETSDSNAFSDQVLA